MARMILLPARPSRPIAVRAVLQPRLGLPVILARSAQPVRPDGGAKVRPRGRDRTRQISD